MCSKCRLYNAARYIASYQNKKESIIEKLKVDDIHKIDLYKVYIQQCKTCYICTNKIKLQSVFVNKFDENTSYCCNIFLSCLYCHKLYDSDTSVHELMGMIGEINIPIEKPVIQHTQRDEKPFINQLLGL
jgi:hypothetical protein